MSYAHTNLMARTGFPPSVLTGGRILHAHGANQASVGSSTML